MNLSYSTFATTFGEFSIALDESGAVVATAFGDRAALAARLGSPQVLSADPRRLEPARRQVQDYLAGRRAAFDLSLSPRGTAFQQRVWAQLRLIPAGETRTYAEIARLIGQPAASRAVGRANATNPICLLIPCHRVIGSNGSLTGFAFGEALKGRLLELERETARRACAA